MTLPVPGNVSRADVDSMKRMMQIMNGASGSNVPAQHTHQAHYSGGYAGTPPPRKPVYESAPPAYNAFPGREDVDAMKRILEVMNELDGPQQAPQRQAITESYSAPAAVASSAEWSIRTNLVESNGKESKTYDVVQGNHAFVEGLVVADAARSLARLLNRGYTAENPRVQEVLDLEETYNRHRLDAARIKGRYNRCVELGEDAAAAVFRERHQVARAEALAIQDQLKSILESIR